MCIRDRYMLRLKLEPSMGENPAELLEEMRVMYQQGCHSPFLYAQAFKLYERNPLLLKKMGDYEVQVLSLIHISGSIRRRPGNSITGRGFRPEWRHSPEQRITGWRDTEQFGCKY